MKKSFATISAICNVSATLAVMLSLVFGQAFHLHEHVHDAVASDEAQQSGCHHHSHAGHHKHESSAAKDESPRSREEEHQHPVHEHDCSICGVIGQASVTTATTVFVAEASISPAPALRDSQPIPDSGPEVIPARGPPAAAC